MHDNLHPEQHFTASKTVRDIIIGMADGLTVPFALAAGLSGAVDHTSIIVVAGLAEIAGGSISMGLGGYLAAKNEVDHYNHEKKREHEEIVHMPERERQEVAHIFAGYGLSDQEIAPILNKLTQNPDTWVDFMMRYELNLEEPDKHRVYKSALTIAVSYLLGGIVPLLPYMFTNSPRAALLDSALLTLAALFVFGYGKARLIGARPFVGAIQTTALGGVAASAAYGLARLFS